MHCVIILLVTYTIIATEISIPEKPAFELQISLCRRKYHGKQLSINTTVSSALQTTTDYLLYFNLVNRI